MNCGDDNSSPPYVSSYQDGPYGSSLGSSASSSSASVWSDTSSQSSDDSSVHSLAVSSDSESDSYCLTAQPTYHTSSNVCDLEVTPTTYWPKTTQVNVAPEQRQNSRRTNTGTVSRSGCPPSLVRQCDRKVNFVDSLVDSSAQIVEAIWPLSSVACRSEMGAKGVLPLRTFIQETLRRSRTSYSTLQVALYYLILVKPHVPKHDFTMEQPEDAHSIRALQCGRRMFLSALILASKYLQDRNYSARAWSKISGLNTQEINQNEMAFLLAVNWRLHITDAVFQRWTDIVLKYTPTQPPSPGSCQTRPAADSSAGWKKIILELNPELDNIDGIIPSTSGKAIVQSISTSSTKPFAERSYTFESESNESTPTPRYYAPQVMEPSPSAAYSTKLVPAFGLLPTPRLTPQGVGFNTPAAGAASYILGKSSMCYAMGQASSGCAAQATNRWPTQPTSSPAFSNARRSSLANSLSSMSSPESMVSDTSTSSRSSRSSSISSASSLMSAPLSSKLDVQARCRYAKQCSDRQNYRTIVEPVPDAFADNAPISSPESYTGLVGKDFLDLSLETPVGKADGSADYFSCDSVNDAARALQELHNNPRFNESPRDSRGSKRSRPVSIDNLLQDNVREMLNGSHRSSSEHGWSSDLVRAPSSFRSISNDAIQAVARGSDGRKRVCCSTEATRGFEPGLLARPGMWAGILN